MLHGVVVASRRTGACLYAHQRTPGLGLEQGGPSSAAAAGAAVGPRVASLLFALALQAEELTAERQQPGGGRQGSHALRAWRSGALEVLFEADADVDGADGDDAGLLVALFVKAPAVAHDRRLARRVAASFAATFGERLRESPAAHAKRLKGASAVLAQVYRDHHAELVSEARARAGAPWLCVAPRRLRRANAAGAPANRKAAEDSTKVALRDARGDKDTEREVASAVRATADAAHDAWVALGGEVGELRVEVSPAAALASALVPPSPPSPAPLTPLPTAFPRLPPTSPPPALAKTPRGAAGDRADSGVGVAMVLSAGAAIAAASTAAAAPLGGELDALADSLAVVVDL